MHSFTKTLKHISENPYLNIIIGLLVLYTGISEAAYELIEHESFRIGAHHGIILFAILHILKTLPNLFIVAKHIEKVVVKEKN